MRRGELSGEFRIAHQSLMEFVSSVTRGRRGSPLMSHEDATRQVELFMAQFPVLYPNEYVFRTALRGMATYRLPWFDAHLWAYADHYGIPEILSEDFTHGRWYGNVRIRNPFLEPGLA
jgi:predicted nucleic acid-binding protein